MPKWQESQLPLILDSQLGWCGHIALLCAVNKAPPDRLHHARAMIVLSDKAFSGSLGNSDGESAPASDQWASFLEINRTNKWESYRRIVNAYLMDQLGIRWLGPRPLKSSYQCHSRNPHTEDCGGPLPQQIIECSEFGKLMPDYDFLSSGNPAVTNHLRVQLALSAESKAHAHAIAPPKLLKIPMPKPQHNQAPPAHCVTPPQLESPPAHNPKLHAQVLIPIHSPSGCPAKRAKVDHQFDKARPQKNLPQVCIQACTRPKVRARWANDGPNNNINSSGTSHTCKLCPWTGIRTGTRSSSSQQTITGNGIDVNFCSYFALINLYVAEVPLQFFLPGGLVAGAFGTWI
ncbi:hypothetical protein FIBSPDRAFT_894003 [Athelia psychrophila]|uniref:Uncharacterized protein n=1 Tax=Athelia psychrophila TaxID=1759441 RepID=A0A166GES5_9AGAM|nr:hypothetical protein FIBSPDRAFT_894003 [Fibularhizoctonia sp. CBS 109695]